MIASLPFQECQRYRTFTGLQGIFYGRHLTRGRAVGGMPRLGLGYVTMKVFGKGPRRWSAVPLNYARVELECATTEMERNQIWQRARTGWQAPAAATRVQVRPSGPLPGV